MSDLLAVFSGLTSENHTVTSPEDTEYNCIAWAAGDKDRWWEPDAWGISYWPPTAPRELTLRAYRQAYGALGYEPCNSREPEAGFEKVALYADPSGKPLHAARQLPNGRWTSKCGQLEDIEHDLDGLTGSCYGQVVLLIRRRSGTESEGAGEIAAQ